MSFRFTESAFCFTAMAGEDAGTVPPLDVTYAQMLGLSPSTPVGTRVSVSDGFVVSLTGTAADGLLFVDSGQIDNDGYKIYHQIGFIDDDNHWFVAVDGGDNGNIWSIQNNNLGSVGSIDVAADTLPNDPWDANWDGLATLTHPAIQTLAAPSTEQGGVFVDAIGVLVDAHESNGGKPKYVLLGVGGTDPSVGGGSYWTGSQWNVYDSSGTFVYYSLSDVATPDLASNWKNASDDSPAAITVTSASISEIYAGLFVSNDGATNGSSYVLQPFHGRQYYMGLNGGGSNNMHWDTDFNVWTDDVGVWTTDNVAFPHQGTDNGGGGHTGATFSRNDVANPANWQ